MEKKDKRPKYAQLEYDVRAALNITWAEYVLVDMLYVLSRRGWCNKQLRNIAADMGLTKHGTMKMLKRLEQRGLIERSDKGYRTLDLYHETKLHAGPSAVEQSYTRMKQSYTRRVTKLHDNRGENNNEINKENRGIKNRGQGYDLAFGIAQRLKRKSAEQ